MDGGDILYIVLLGFFLLSGLFKKLMPKKKEEDKQMPTIHTQMETVEDFDDWYNRLDEEPQMVISSGIPREYSNLSTTNNQQLYEASKKKAVEPIVHPSLKNDYTNEYKIEIELDTVEEARKAFIYSEIFQRKYYN